METRVSTRGQIVLPKAICDKRRWKAGTRLVVEDRPDGVLLKAAEGKKKFSVHDLRGIARYKGPAHTIEEMNAGIVAEARRRFARGRY